MQVERIDERELINLVRAAHSRFGVHARPGQLPWLRQLAERWRRTWGPSADPWLPEVLASALRSRPRHRRAE